MIMLALEWMYRMFDFFFLHWDCYQFWTLTGPSQHGENVQAFVRFAKQINSFNWNSTLLVATGMPQPFHQTHTHAHTWHMDLLCCAKPKLGLPDRVHDPWPHHTHVLLHGGWSRYSSDTPVSFRHSLRELGWRSGGGGPVSHVSKDWAKRSNLISQIMTSMCVCACICVCVCECVSSVCSVQWEVEATHVAE